MVLMAFWSLIGSRVPLGNDPRRLRWRGIFRPLRRFIGLPARRLAQKIDGLDAFQIRLPPHLGAADWEGQ